MSTDTRPSKRAKVKGEKIELVQPKVGDRVYARFLDNGSWYWGVATNKFYKEDGCLYYSIQYEDGDFVEEHRATDGIATEEQYNWKGEGELSDDSTTPATVPSTLTPSTAEVVTPDRNTETIPSRIDHACNEDRPVPDPAPSSTRAEEVHRDVLKNFSTDLRIKEEGCASTLTEAEREKRKKSLQQWISASTDPRTGKGRYVFARCCRPGSMTSVLGGAGMHPWPEVKYAPLVNGEPNPFIKQGEFYVAGNEEWNFFGPRFPGDTGLVNLAVFNQNRQSAQKEFHLFVECSTKPHKRHWHGKQAAEGRMYVGVYRKVVDEDGNDDVATIVHMDDQDLDWTSRLGISEHQLKWALKKDDKNFMETNYFQLFKRMARQKAGEEAWHTYSDSKQNNLAMYEILLAEKFTIETVPAEFVRYDEDLYQALVDAGAAKIKKGVPCRVALTPEALHHWY